MIQGWHTYLLSELLTIKNGKDHKTLAEGKYPVIGSGGIMRYADSFLYNKPSILLPRKGTLDNIQFCDTPFWTVDTLYYTEVKDSLTHPYYLYWYLRMLDLSKLDSGTGVPSMTFESYYNIKVNLPSLSVQHKIGKLLSDIDRKIALNRRMNATLEAMARQLYDYWFVQFDFPDADGKPYKSSGGKMTWNDKLKREIPEGWSVENLADFADIKNGATPSTTDESNYGGDIVWITPKDLSDQQSKFIYHGERNITKQGLCSCSTSLLPINSVLMSSRAPIGLVSIAKHEVCTNQGFKSFVPHNMDDSIYLYYYIKHHIRQIEQLGSGTTFKEVSREDLSKFPILVVGANKAYEQWIRIQKEISDKQFILTKEIDTLTRLRTTLLPLLMNGQVSVND